MKLSLRLSSDLSPERMLQGADTVDSAGMDQLWLADNPLERSAIVSAAVIAARYPALDIGLGIVSARERHPVVLTQEALALQSYSRGRVVLGLGLGSEAHRVRLGLPRKGGLATLRDTAAAVKALSAGGGIPAQGENPDPPVTLHVHGDAALPVYIGASGHRTLAESGRIADGVVLSLGTTTQAAATAGRIAREAHADAGRQGRFEVVCYVGFGGIGPGSYERAEKFAAGFLGAIVANPYLDVLLDGTGLDLETADAAVRAHREGTPLPRDVVQAMGISGSVAECLDRLRAYAAAGVDVVALGLGRWNAEFGATLADVRTLALAWQQASRRTAVRTTAGEDTRDEVGAWVSRDVTVTGGAGPLAGWTVGVKDLIDVAGLPTAAGAHDGSVPPPAATDAPVIARLRGAGAAIAGKTTAVEYGWFGTVVTRNPHDLDRSPGGSSSGSAAAVAAGTARIALGTQTAGSVIRPAAFCGVPAVKYSHGALDLTGVVGTSPTLDTLGLFARSVSDLAATSRVLLNGDPAETAGAESRIALGFLDPTPWAVDPAVRGRFGDALALLTAAGIDVRLAAPAVDWTELAGAHRTIMVTELSRIHRQRFQDDPGHFSASLGGAIAAGQQVADADYRRALDVREAAAAAFADALSGIDAFVTPAAPSYAPPAGVPGDPACNVPFTLAGLPAVALPLPPVPGLLPAGLQLVGPLGADLNLLQVAARCEAALSGGRR